MYVCIMYDVPRVLRGAWGELPWQCAKENDWFGQKLKIRNGYIAYIAHTYAIRQRAEMHPTYISNEALTQRVLLLYSIILN